MRGFRAARPASFGWNYGKTVLQTTCFWIVFLIAIPCVCILIDRQFNLPAFEFAGQTIVGVALFIVAGAVALYAGFTMARVGKGTPLPIDCPRELVISGPYSHVRNPMALSGIVQGLAIGIGLGSWTVIAYAALGVPVWHFLARPSEEADMEERFGESFNEYRRNVRLWIPRLAPYSSQKQ